MPPFSNKTALRKNDSVGSLSVKRWNESDFQTNVKKLKTNENKLDNNSAASKEIKCKISKCVKSKSIPKKRRSIKTENPKEGIKEEVGNDEKLGSFGKQEQTTRGIRNITAKNTETISEGFCDWRDEDYLAEFERIPVQVAKNIIKLLKEENTVPFIARYRSDLTGGLKPDKLRKVRDTYEYVQKVHEKARHLHKHLLAAGALTPALLSYIRNARTVEELDFVGSQFKKGSRRSLAERARRLGLQGPAESILEGRGVVSLDSLVSDDVTELNDVNKVALGIEHIIADVISKTAQVHSELEKIYSSNLIIVRSKFKKASEEEVSSKYQLYGNFSRPLHLIKPYQILAISRGESENELSLKIVIPDSLWLPLKSFCKSKWLLSGTQYSLRTSLVERSVDDVVKRLLGPLAVRRVKAKLRAEAENEALCVFGYNLRQLLMTPPCSGRVVMGVDPGFAKGCKVAVVSPKGDVLGHDRFFLRDQPTARKKLRSLISEFKCEIIALGNGHGCRQTEALLSKFISRGCFKPLNVSYTVVSEQAVSIYSCSPIAAEEFPDLDPTVVGSISLARRLQNPLSELVKVEPRHLGVGMYQHDVREKKLETVLDEIVTECVSFVGVDVNSASVHLLKRVAGLNTSKAQEIIKYRTEVCSFKRREDLMKVKGIKAKTFRQCAGFLRIVPSTARCKRHKSCKSEEQFNPFDETSIHPELYETAYKLIDLFGVTLDQLGTDGFIETVKSFESTTEELAKYCECSELVVAFIVDTLTKPKNFDMRSHFVGPIFRREIKTLEELLPNQSLEGVVRNIVSFGAFVDVGVGIDGLIHVTQMRNFVLHLNNRVKVQVISVDKVTQKIQLKLISLIE